WRTVGDPGRQSSRAPPEGRTRRRKTRSVSEFRWPKDFGVALRAAERSPPQRRRGGSARRSGVADVERLGPAVSIPRRRRVHDSRTELSRWDGQRTRLAPPERPRPGRWGHPRRHRRWSLAHPEPPLRAGPSGGDRRELRSEEHTSELQSRFDLV